MRLEGNDKRGGGRDKGVGQIDYVERQILVALLLRERVAEHEQARSGEDEVTRSPEVLALLLCRSFLETTCQSGIEHGHCEIPIREGHFVGLNVLCALKGSLGAYHSES